LDEHCEDLSANRFTAQSKTVDELALRQTVRIRCEADSRAWLRNVCIGRIARAGRITPPACSRAPTLACCHPRKRGPAC